MTRADFTTCGKRPLGKQARFLGVIDNVLIEAIHKRILESFIDIEFAPRQVLHFCLNA
jgi:hypothetical protein